MWWASCNLYQIKGSIICGEVVDDLGVIFHWKFCVLIIYFFSLCLSPLGFYCCFSFSLSFFFNHKIHREKAGVSWSTLQYLGFLATTLWKRTNSSGPPGRKPGCAVRGTRPRWTELVPGELLPVASGDRPGASKVVKLDRHCRRMKNTVKIFNLIDSTWNQTPG